jgi:hypothetical protein
MSNLSHTTKPFIKFTEISTRFGFSQLAQPVNFHKRKDVIHTLVYSGLKSIEIGNVCDDLQLYNTLIKFNDVQYSMFLNHNDIPNFIKKTKLDQIKNLSEIVTTVDNILLTNTRSTNQRKQQLATIQDLRTFAKDIPLRVYINHAFVCPHTGKTTDTFFTLLWLKRLKNLGIESIDLVDDYGLASPIEFQEVISNVRNFYHPEQVGLCLSHQNPELDKMLHMSIQNGINNFHTSFFTLENQSTSLKTSWLNQWCINNNLPTYINSHLLSGLDMYMQPDLTMDRNHYNLIKN